MKIGLSPTCWARAEHESRVRSFLGCPAQIGIEHYSHNRRGSPSGRKQFAKRSPLLCRFFAHWPLLRHLTLHLFTRVARRTLSCGSLPCGGGVWFSVVQALGDGAIASLGGRIGRTRRRFFAAGCASRSLLADASYSVD